MHLAMDKVGLIVLIILLSVLDIASATVSTSAGGHEVSSEDIDRILKRLEDSESLTQRLLGRVEQLESRDKIQQEEIRNLKSALNQRSDSASEPMNPNNRVSRYTNADYSQHLPNRQNQHGSQIPQLWNKSSKSLRITPSKHAVRRVRSSEENNDSSLNVQKKILPQVQNIAQQHRMRRQGSSNTPHVAFSATLTSHQTNNGQHQPIIFDNVVTNFGSAYHNHLGSFIAPFDGTYVFSTTLLAMHSTSGNFILTKNGAVVTWLYHGITQGAYTACSQTFILHLHEGDDVNIQNYEAGKGVYGSHYSTFSGFLLFEDENQAIIG